ncbi:MAG: universal stress protein [Deltaproteobacteria bacterium]|nr:universal stress protein [Deltaproteobacteria bacterium]
MGCLLLAIDSDVPYQWTIRYTVQLCKSLHAQLHVLWVVPPGSADRTDRLALPFEDHGIPYSIEKRFGNPTTEIVNYLKAHHEIFLAIYDLSDSIGILAKRATRARLKSFLNAVEIPMVTVRPQRIINKHRILHIISTGIKEVAYMTKLFSIFKRKAPKAVEASVELTDIPASEAERQTKLVVVGQESRFSDSIINYALDMARRMDYQILALNTAPLSCETFQLFSSSRAQVCQDFEALSQKNAQKFKARCEIAGIDFTQVVKFVETNGALEQIKAEFDDIGFIVSEPEEQRTQAQHTMDGQRPETSIRVYSVI